MVRDAAVAGKALEGAQRLASCCHHLFQFLTGSSRPGLPGRKANVTHARHGQGLSAVAGDKAGRRSKTSADDIGSGNHKKGPLPEHEGLNVRAVGHAAALLLQGRTGTRTGTGPKGEAVLLWACTDASPESFPFIPAAAGQIVSFRTRC